MPPRAPKTQALERYSVEREGGAPLYADCTTPGEPLLTIPLGSTVVMLEEHTPQRAGKVGGVSASDAEPWIHVVGFTHLAQNACDGWVRKSDLVHCGARSVELNGSDEVFEMRRDLVAGQIMIKFSNRSILPLKLKKDQSHDELALAQFIRERRSDGDGARARAPPAIDYHRQIQPGPNPGVPGHRAHKRSAGACSDVQQAAAKVVLCLLFGMSCQMGHLT